jgi:hypothetical protein
LIIGIRATRWLLPPCALCRIQWDREAARRLDNLCRNPVTEQTCAWQYLSS